MIASKPMHASDQRRNEKAFYAKLPLLGVCTAIHAWRKESPHAIWDHSQTRHFGRTHCRTSQAGGSRWLPVWVALRLARVVERSLSSVDSDGGKYPGHAAGNPGDESGSPRSHGNLESVCHFEPDLPWPDGTRHRTRRQFAPCAGEKARELVATGGRGKNFSRSDFRSRNRI